MPSGTADYKVGGALKSCHTEFVHIYGAAFPYEKGARPAPSLFFARFFFRIPIFITFGPIKTSAMIYRFLMLSDEVDDFKREIRIDSEATFLDLREVILDSVKYTKDQLDSFFICEEDWSKRTEVTLMEMDTNSDEDNYTMADTRLDELIEEEGQRLLFVFDNMTERAFFMELREIIPGQDLKEPICSKSVGDPPAQLISFDDFETKNNTSSDVGEDFYGDSEYDIDELDQGGFEGLDGPMDNPYDEDRY